MRNPRIIYILEKTELSGGVKVVLEHADWLNLAGIPTEIFSLQETPDWFQVHSPITTFRDYDSLKQALKEVRALKIATLWRTAPVVAECSMGEEGCYLVQDIETSYYTDTEIQREVISTYDLPLTMIVTSKWIEFKLMSMGKQCKYIGLGIDHTVFKPMPATRSIENTVLINAPRYPRHWRIKGMDILIDALKVINSTTPSTIIKSFSTEPVQLPIPNINIIHSPCPTDVEVASLYQNASCFLITSRHEGFCLPALEAMACGCPVVCTLADGNEEFCVDGQTCLLADKSPHRIAEAVVNLLSNEALREKLISGGVATAKKYRWENVIIELNNLLISKHL